MVDPESVPVTKMRSPLAIDEIATVCELVTRVLLDVVTFTLVFEAVSAIVNVLPSMAVIFPEVPGMFPRRLPVAPVPELPLLPVAAAPVVDAAASDLCESALAPKKPPTTSTIAPTVDAATTHAGRFLTGAGSSRRAGVRAYRS